MHKPIHSSKKGIFFAILAACLYTISSPCSKTLLADIPPAIMAGILYIGAGLGMGLIFLLKKSIISINKTLKDCDSCNSLEYDSCSSLEENLTLNDLPYVIAMIVLDIAAPILLMCGLRLVPAATVSLLNNFEIAATCIIAYFIFGEKISTRLCTGICLVTLSCALLSFEISENFGLSEIFSGSFSYGSILVIAASLCWGFENNCTRRISSKNPLQIVFLKGIFSGIGSLIIGLIAGERLTSFHLIPVVLLLGFAAYGLSIFVYIHAQRLIGAAKTSAFYAIAPFIGAAMSFIFLQEVPDIKYFAALAIMIIGAWLCS